MLDKGDHRITSTWIAPGDVEEDDPYETTLGITRSNIVFLGNGKATTTILGGFGIHGLENITFKNMTVTNTNEGCGISMSNAKVELFNVALERCDDAGLFIRSAAAETTVVATRCEFANNIYGGN